MPTYLYKCQEHGEFEYEHSIKDKMEECPHCKINGKLQKISRLICNENGFILQGSGWAKDNYS